MLISYLGPWSKSNDCMPVDWLRFSSDTTTTPTIVGPLRLLSPGYIKYHILNNLPTNATLLKTSIPTRILSIFKTIFKRLWNHGVPLALNFGLKLCTARQIPRWLTILHWKLTNSLLNLSSACDGAYVWNRQFSGTACTYESGPATGKLTTAGRTRLSTHG